MTTVALYARYFSDQQNEVSIEDQLRICREHAARESWRVVAIYHDAAISGSTLNRESRCRISQLMSRKPIIRKFKILRRRLMIDAFSRKYWMTSGR